jgi:hypothetical protein
MMSGLLHAEPLYRQGKLLHSPLNRRLGELKRQSWMLVTEFALSLHSNGFYLRVLGQIKENMLHFLTNTYVLMLYGGIFV